MKKIPIVILYVNLMLTIGLILFLFFKKEKIVYVDANKLINGYERMVNARTEYQQKVKIWKANIDTLALELNQKIKEFERDKPKMTSRELSVSQELITTKQNQFRDFQQAMNAKAQQEDEEMTKKIVEEINNYLAEYGRQNGYKIILAATNYGNIAYAEDDLDLTESILKELNESYGKK